MKIILFATLSFLLSQQVLAQPDPLSNFNRHVIASWTGQYVRISQYQVKGTPYLFGEPFNGSITYNGGKPIVDKKIWYNLYSQKAGIDVNNELFESDDRVSEFILQLPRKFGGQTLLFKNASVFGSTDLNGFLNVLEEGSRVSFLKMYKVRLSPDPTNMLAKDKKVFEQYLEYYLHRKGALKKIKLKQRDILKELGDEIKLKDYITKNNLDLSSEEDVIKLIKLYNNK